MFRGTSHHAIDAKGRTSLPAEYRAILAEQGEERLFFTAGLDGALWAFVPKDYLALETMLGSHSQFDEETREIIDAIVGSARETPLDKMGRVLVPQELREFAGLEAGQVVWTGSIDRVRLWSESAWKQRQQRVLAKLNGGGFQKLAEFEKALKTGSAK